MIPALYSLRPASSEQLEEDEEEELRGNTHAHQGLSGLLGQPVEPFSQFAQNCSGEIWVMSVFIMDTFCVSGRRP
jgi:hypothetical protein